MIDMSKFAKLAEVSRYPFGIDKARVAEALRDVANRIDRGELSPTGASLLAEVSNDDFLLETLVIQFAPKGQHPAFPSSPETAASIRTELRGAAILVQYWHDPTQSPPWIISAWTAGETMVDVPLDPAPTPAELVMLSAMVRANAEGRGFLAPQ
jgi:hypothetical protein